MCHVLFKNHPRENKSPEKKEEDSIYLSSQAPFKAVANLGGGGL